MLRTDIQILRALSKESWPTIIKLLRSHNLSPQDASNGFTRARTMVTTLHLHHLTMADILHALTLSSRTSLKSVQILRQIYTTLLPTIPQSLTPLLNYGHISAVYPEFLQHPNPAYQVGASVADLHLILGIPLSTINKDISRGAIVLYSASIPRYNPPTEEDEDVNS